MWDENTLRIKEVEIWDAAWKSFNLLVVFPLSELLLSFAVLSFGFSPVLSIILFGFGWLIRILVAGQYLSSRAFKTEGWVRFPAAFVLAGCPFPMGLGLLFFFLVWRPAMGWAEDALIESGIYEVGEQYAWLARAARIAGWLYFLPVVGFAILVGVAFLGRG